MSKLSHEERIVSRCRDVFSGRNVTFAFAAETCGITEEAFMVHYDAYIRRLTRAIETRQEWLLLCELEYLLRAGYMRPQDASKRFRAPEESIKQWIEEKNREEGKPNWCDMRLMRARQGKTDEKDTE